MLNIKKHSSRACPVKLKRSGGFTLLEILLVVGIIAILAGIVIVAINPSKQLATVRNTERKSDIKQIDSALTQYYIDNNHYPTSLTSTLTEVCDTGALSTTTGSDIACTDLIDLTPLVPLYITAIPTDPQASTTNGAGYSVIKTSNKIGLSALAELGQTITLGTVEVAEVATPVNGVCNNATIYACTAGDSASNVPGSCGGSATWSCNGTNGGTNATNCTKANEACAAATYTITYDGNTNTSGTVPADQTKTEDVTLTLRTNSGTLAKTGYTFAGWNTAANGSGTTYAVGANYTANAAATMYAKWTANPVNGVCNNATIYACTAGDSASNVPGSCGGSATWSCNGTNGGTNATNCTKANEACPITFAEFTYGGHTYQINPTMTSAKKWGPMGVTTGIQSTTDGVGNTDALALLGPTYEAATVVKALSDGGYTDWFLPAKDELDAALTEYGVQFPTNPTWGGFEDTIRYWSSTESDIWSNDASFDPYYDSGNNSVNTHRAFKNSTSPSVRAVRIKN